MMLPQETIRRKRDGAALTDEEIRAFVAGVGSGRVTDAQIAAFAMAVFFRGMTDRETVALTLAMRDSGDVLDWRDIDRPVLDKHSTGGVGDNVSLVLAPVVAACGGAVPMISGRGLAHTGGTLDKLESIPGYAVAPDAALFRRTVRDVGCAIVGANARLTPADGRFYAVRDVTATVESVPLIVASILSKKLSAGLNGLVLDVKVGTGAFMAGREDARGLAENLVAVASGAGLPALALVTDMNEPLASVAGNAVETLAAVRLLTGAGDDEPRLREVVLRLAGEMLALGGLAAGVEDGERRAAAALAEGRAAETFGRMVAALGGPADFVERADSHLPRAPIVREASAERDGFVCGVDARALGLAVVALGGGRTRPQDGIDHAVGLTRIAAIGRPVRRGEPLALVHARSETQAHAAIRAVRAAFTLGEAAPAVRPVVLARISE